MKSKISARDYLLKYPSATTKAVIRATGVSAKTVYSVRWKLKEDEKDPVKDKANSERAKTLRIQSNSKLIDLSIAGSPLRPKIRMASSADFPITDKTEFIMPDPVNHPAHYTTGGIETIDFIEAKGLGYNLGNVVKYITRADHKGNRVEDLRKAKWYLEREILSAHI
jgi:hypothetical protein